jgi:para-nitrobenzyl esterase
MLRTVQSGQATASSALDAASVLALDAARRSQAACCVALLLLAIARNPAPAITAADADTPIATTECGPVRGTLEAGLAVFKSIPYARAERWGRPQPASCWSGTLDTTAYRPQCIQLLGVIFPWHRGPPIAAEECQTLTVWGANATSDPLPVIVFFHGGMLTVGTARQNFSLLQQSGVVIVNVAYRLNVFGYLSTRELAAVDSRGTSGNYGLLDQIEALRWVQRNIHHFRGDPTRVTAMGESAGGTSVYSMLACPPARGLFHRALVISGSPNKTSTVAAQQAQHASIVTAMGCGSGDAATVVACMRNKPIVDLLQALPLGPDHGPPETNVTHSWLIKDSIFNVPIHADGLRMPTLLSVDGLCPEKPLLEALREPIIDVPLVVSTMAQEQGQWAGNHFNASSMSAPEFVAQLGRYFDEMLGEGFGAELATHYEADIAESPQKAWGSIAADIAMTCGNMEVAAAAAAGFGSPVYRVYNTMHSDTRMWAYHHQDMHLAQTDAGARGRRLRGWWREFAATGAVADWRAAAGGGGGIVTNVVANNSLHAERAFKAGVCALWREHGAGPEFWW